MKKIFTLAAMAMFAMSMNAQTTIFWEDGLTSANSVTFSNGYTLTITEKPNKTLGKGSTITVDGNEYLTIKLSNGAQNTLTAPDGTTFNKITFYSYMNCSLSKLKTNDEGNPYLRDSYWKEVNGTAYDATSKGVMKSTNLSTDDLASVANGDTYVGLDQPDKVEFTFDEPVSTMTFTNTGEQLGFIMVLESVATGINNINSEVVDLNAPIYNLAGQRVDKNYKGVVIRNGKKYIQ